MLSYFKHPEMQTQPLSPPDTLSWLHHCRSSSSPWADCPLPISQCRCDLSFKVQQHLINPTQPRLFRWKKGTFSRSESPMHALLVSYMFMLWLLKSCLKWEGKHKCFRIVRCITVFSLQHLEVHEGRDHNLSLFLHESVKVLAAQSCPTLCDPMDTSPPGSSVHGLLQARILKWVAIPFSRGSCWPRDWTWVSCIAGGLFTIWAAKEVHDREAQLFPQRFTKWRLYVFFSGCVKDQQCTGIHQMGFQWGGHWGSESPEKAKSGQVRMISIFKGSF